MNIPEKTLKTIEEKHIKPCPRWRFCFANYSRWGIITSAILAGALVLSVMIFLAAEEDWDVYSHLGNTLPIYVILLTPYLWILVFLGIAAVAYFNFKNTATGYRYGNRFIIFSFLIASTIVGLLFFSADLGAKTHEALMENVPIYNTLGYYKEDVWSNPDRGLLGGQIKEAADRNDFILQDFSGKMWEIKTATSNGCCDLSLIEEGEKVELVGQCATDSNTFYVNSIRPWEKRGR